jgi:hypothetical protein
MVENRIYSSRVFRKLHLEVAWRQDGLQVLHGVFFPRSVPFLLFLGLCIQCLISVFLPACKLLTKMGCCTCAWCSSCCMRIVPRLRALYDFM